MLHKPKTASATIDVVQEWLLSRSSLSIEGIKLFPQENTYLKGSPLMVARGQAQAFYLKDDAKRVWILKKFLPGRSPDLQYVKAVQTLVPPHPGFESGYQRRVLSQESINANSLPSPHLPSWIHNTILMPRVEGSDWATIADRVRDGTITLSAEQRQQICRNLAGQVQHLERMGLSHRDLSSTNVFIDTRTWAVHLIDWDSIYHASLSIPGNTTCGTNGYVAPFVKTNGSEDVRITWAAMSDRFGLAVLNVEFLTVNRNSPVTGDGGLLDQDEINKRGGRGMDQIRLLLGKNFPRAESLFEKALNSRGLADCPSPDEWLALIVGVKAPSLSDVYDPQADFLRCIQLLQKESQPAPPAPRLSDFENPDVYAALAEGKTGPPPPAPSLAGLEPIDLKGSTSLTCFENAPAAPPLPSLETHKLPAGAAAMAGPHRSPRGTESDVENES